MEPTITSPHQDPISPTALDGDFDEEFAMHLHSNVTPPPPPPPPPPPRRKSGGSSRHSRSLPEPMPEQTPEQMLQEPPTLHREPLNALEQQQQQDQQLDGVFPSSPKEQSGCQQDDELMGTQTTKPPRPVSTKVSEKPPRQAGSKSAEYASNLESFHMIMLENIEKETSLIRRQGSFQVHQNHLEHQRIGRKHGNQQHDENNQVGATPKRKTKQQQQQLMGLDDPNNNMGSLLKETMNDISVAAASTMESMKNLIQQHTQQDKNSGKTNVVLGNTVVPLPVKFNCGKIEDSATAFMNEEEEDDSVVDNKPQPRSATSEFLQNNNSTKANDLMKKMHDGFNKLVVTATNAAGKNDDESRNDQQQRPAENDNSAEAWGVGNLLANGFGWEQEEEDEIQSKATYDTWDEENSVLRRLGSWGTVNSQFTAATAGTSATFGTMATCDTEGPSVIGPVSQALAKAKQHDTEGMAPPGSHHLRNNQSSEVMHDDDGSLIDPALVEAAKKKKKKRRTRRKKVVKFDYPPIKSLRQYTRPDPEDLPNLFFTEQELDQIEDDRYSTMSTDDIEIVAVASKEDSQRGDDDDALDARAAASKSSRKKEVEADYEPGFKPVKGRSGTPDRRRPGSADFSKKSPKNAPAGQDESSEEKRSSPRRLVKGVQIYLRERSTGA